MRNEREFAPTKTRDAASAGAAQLVVRCKIAGDTIIAKIAFSLSRTRLSTRLYAPPDTGNGAASTITQNAVLVMNSRDFVRNATN